MEDVAGKMPMVVAGIGKESMLGDEYRACKSLWEV